MANEFTLHIKRISFEGASSKKYYDFAIVLLREDSEQLTLEYEEDCSFCSEIPDYIYRHAKDYAEFFGVSISSEVLENER